MPKIGYSLVQLATGAEVAAAAALPCRLTVGGVGVTDFDSVGQTINDAAGEPTHKLVERWANGPPTSRHTLASETATFDGEKVTLERTWNDPPAPTVEELKQYAAAKRRELANGSALVDVGSRTIPTWVDPESRGAITGLVVATGVVPGLTAAPWKGADGAFYTLTAAEITALALGMMNFVQACFATEATVMDGIGAGTITTFGAVDAADWPG